MKKFWSWLSSLWTTRYKITVSYDSQFGNDDDVVYEDVIKISKQNFKELVFINKDKQLVVIRCANGLKYRIEVM